ncbi:S22AD protein, partial [Amia calva]|nr:S22AD protein [Amia calva]
MADFGEILIAIGDYGLFQKLLLFGLCFPNLILPFHLYSLIFTDANDIHYCNTDWILKVSPNLTGEQQLNLTVPREQDGSFKSCEMFTPVDWDIESIMDYGINTTTSCQDGWVYENPKFKSTVLEFNLVCRNAYLRIVAQFLFMVGIMVGAFIFGPLSERLGRRRATQIPLVLMLIFGLGTGLAPNYYVYITTQFVVGISFGGFRVNCVLLATEWIGVSKRSYPSSISKICNAVGQCLIAVIAFCIRDWRIVQYVITSPLVVVVIYIWLIPESARWLLSRGRNEEAKKFILKAAAINKSTVPSEILNKITVHKSTDNGTIWDLFKSPLLRKYTLILNFSWFATNIALYSLSFNVGNFGLNIFLTQLLFGLVEIPANFICIWLLEIWGRRISQISTLVVGGVICFLISAVPQDNAIIVTSFAIFGKFCITWAGTVCNVFIQEVFPTSVRQSANGLGAMSARMGGILAPLVNLLKMVHWAIPTSINGTFLLVGGCLSFMLPETMRTELPDHTDDVSVNEK